MLLCNEGEMERKRRKEGEGRRERGAERKGEGKEGKEGPNPTAVQQIGMGQKVPERDSPVGKWH